MTTSGMPQVVIAALAPAIDRYHWIDGLQRGTVHRPLRTLARAGGKGINAARVLAALGVPTGVVVPVPDSAIPEMTASLQHDRIMASRFVSSPGPARHTVTLIDERAGDATEIYEPAAPLALAGATALVEAVDELAAAAAAIVISGTPAPVGGFGEALAAALVGRQRQAAHLYVDARATILRPLIAAGLPVTVKVNAAEAAELVGAAPSTPLGELAAAVRAAGASTAIVTGGLAGAACATVEGVVDVAAPRLHGRYPGGSGDAFLAGYVAARVQGAGIESALTAAAARAAANAAVPTAGELG